MEFLSDLFAIKSVEVKAPIFTNNRQVPEIRRQVNPAADCWAPPLDAASSRSGLKADMLFLH